MIKGIDTQERYINRELSWIKFNERVLKTAFKDKYKILDKIKFSSIFSNNLDEFFMVRVASLKAQVEAELTKKSIDGSTPKQQLIDIKKNLEPLLKYQEKNLNEIIQKDLRKENIYIMKYKELSNQQRMWIDNYFISGIFPILTPLLVDPAHPFPFISNLSLNIAAIIRDPLKNIDQFVRLKIPIKPIGRLISIPNKLIINEKKHNIYYIPIEEVVINNLQTLFPGMKTIKHALFRITRDADLELKELEADDLLIAIEQSLQRRRLGGEVVRLEVENKIDNEILELLMKGMKISKDEIYFSKSYLGIDEFNSLTQIDRGDLKEHIFIGKTNTSLQNLIFSNELSTHEEQNKTNIFDVIKQKDILLHHPYDLFKSSIEEFINTAAEDNSVMGIKMTLYRVSKGSAIINALIKAAENGKEVMALVELKARFDEDNNIQWAKQLEQAGVHVVYGIIGFKTHTKICLVIRKEKERLRSYFHIGTGNYNSKTSKYYTDLGLLSANPDLADDLIELFNFLTGCAKQSTYKKLLVAPGNLRQRLENLIKRETKFAREGKEAAIIAKMNSLVDPTIIDLLYEASQAGVSIKLIIRGICCLYPGKKELSENIEVISIIGHFLEHSRIFWFNNNDNSEVFIGSADWMRRNLDRRIEAVTPILDIDLRKKLEFLLNMYLKDNSNAWKMKGNGSYELKQNELQKFCSQSEVKTFWQTPSP
tara:strand:- start:9208 stop:11331 length:2124 start_codon:yes stop_codon:yes gene_type:complete